MDHKSRARRVDPSHFALLVEQSAEGMTVVNAAGTTSYVNAAAATLLDVTKEALVGSPAWYLRDDVRRPRGVETRILSTGDGCRLVHLWDSRPDRRERQLAAFATTSATIAREATLSGVLDRLAHTVMTTTGMATCALVLLDGPDEDTRYVGQAGLPPDYVERFDASRRNGAPSVTSEVFRTGRPAIAMGTRHRVLSDDRWSPAQPLLRGNDWDAFVAVPLTVRGRQIGALNGFYPGGVKPDREDLRFLALMANHAAIAIDNARMLSSLQLRAAEAERVRLAGDLHDSVSQALFSLSLQAKGLELRSAVAEPSFMAQDFREIRELAQHALGEMRSLIQFRRPVELRDESLVVGLQRLALSVTQRSGLDVVLEDHLGVAVALDEFLEDDLFRLVQEALNNVLKHAHAQRATVTLARRGRADLVVIVADDGRGMSEPSGSGFGMATMRERAERHAGRFSITSNDDGTTVTVIIPSVALPDPPPQEDA